MSLSRRSASIALAIVLSPAVVFAQRVSAESAARIDSVFSRFTSSSPGCALNILRGDSSVYARGYGLASLELGVPISTRTVFDIGSTSKQFTAASVVLLALDGKLSLDDNVRKFIPELPDLGHTVTLRHLLTHTSGWRDYIDLMVLAGWDDRDHTTDRDALDVLRRQRELSFVPGSDYRYSNTGFFLLSLVVQRASGKSLADFARERIFEPLGMHDTHYLTESREVIPGKATAYDRLGPGKWLVDMSNWEQIGDGGVQTTVEDLARWNANFESGVVGGRAMLELMQTPASLSDGTRLTYAFGLAVDTYHGLARVSHGGAWGGYRAMLMRFPTERLAVLTLCNVGDANTTRLATGAADALLSPYHQAVVAMQSHGDAVRSAQPATRFAGAYFDESVGSIVRFVADSGGLVMGPGERGRTPLVSDGANRFRTPTGDIWQFDAPSSDGTPAKHVTRTAEPRPIVYVRVDTTVPSQRFAEYAGSYVSPEVGVTWTLIAKNDTLMLHQQRGSDMPLHPLFRDAFAGVGVLRFQRDTHGLVTGLTVTSRGVHALRFDRR